MTNVADSSAKEPRGSSNVLAILYWLAVGIPLAWGVYQTVQKSIPLFSITGAPVVATSP